MKILPKDFYTGDDVVGIAQSLLGKIIVSQINGNKIISRIVETEAYRGPEDRASHSYNNRFTERTRVMYEEGGVAYIYISYGVHHMLNVVTGAKGLPHAVLIRAIEPLHNVEAVQALRQCSNSNYLLSGGPGKVCQGLGIDKTHNGLQLYHKNESIYLADDGFVATDIKTTARVGMSIHVGEASHWPWRFYLNGNKFVSKPLLVKYKW